MIGVHILIQMSLGQVLTLGIVDLNRKFSFNRLPDAEGPRNPTLQSFKELLLLLTVGEGKLKKKLFTCVADSGNGVVCGYFSSVDQSIKDRVPKISWTIAAQLYNFLIKRGVTTESIKRMFKKAFTIEQNKSVSSSKYSKREGFAKVKEEVMGDDIFRAAEAAGIDTSLGLTASQRRERWDNTEFDATQISFRNNLMEAEQVLTYCASEVGAFEAYDDLREEQSQTTLHTRRSNNSRSVAINTLAQSQYSIGNSSSGDNSTNEDGIGGEESETDLARRMVFEGLDLLKRPEAEEASQSNNEDKDKEEEEVLKSNLDFHFATAISEN